MPTDRLFVYGTLMSRAGGALGRAERERLGRESEILGPATVPGHLYDLGRYPGLVERDQPLEAAGDSAVHGEVTRLLDPMVTLAWLDAYEGIGSGRENDEYRRVEREATLADGTLTAVWLYLYTRPTKSLRRIAGGRWIE